MSSSILSIYDTLAATTVTVNGSSISVRDADELPNSVATAVLPLRLLTPLAPFGTEVSATANSVPMSGGGAPFEVEWAIADLLLWAPVSSSLGIRASGKELIAYCAEYLDMLRTLEVPFVMRAQLVPDVFNYPLSSEFWFYGVRSSLFLKEKFQ